jgi:surfactin synthase thioesterase subunit
MYHSWPAHTGSVEICPVQLPGRENRIREPHFGTYEELAKNLAEGLEPYLDRPFGFFGHCGGALAAFAVTRRLEQDGQALPSCLFVSSQVAPHEGPFGRFLDMDDEGLRGELRILTIALHGKPSEDGIELSLSVLKADLTANRAFRDDVPGRLSAHLHSICWRDDVEIEPGRMSGWQEYGAPDGYFRTILVGGHHTFLNGPVVLLDVFKRGFVRARRAGQRP